ncbi:UDP-N-acetylmuramate--L-alanine ligase [Thalassospira lucentensis]|uniref:UDP-N-acetylmuramate--L-alanine ligase n=1 Tax=Thalassospira lucentensis TaxID=168935 RepID=UPI00142D7BE0|nr:UDP-N-acetylmuramate--L-alanine ligase [Thalassospira lucentensis]NIZ02823.1 UDP-N-acetylmuramate--L-alanine ligase [Thalassospira lucentensis]
MNTLPLNIGTIHFVGIGGIGMSGIAEILNNLGYTVQGSDISDNANVQRLRDLGIKVFVGHKGENVVDAKVVVISTAVKPDNPEVIAARADMIPVVRRAEMLAELMRLKAAIAVGGTHGKTTTTSLVATMLDAAGLDPTVINGGIINSYGTNARLGDGDWMVVEADESDGTFVKVPSTISVVTNIDPEHLDHWKDFDQLREAFKNFVQNIPFYGFAVLCIDHPEVQALIGKVSDRRIFTFGFSPQADVRAVNVRTNIGDSVFDVVIRERVDSEERVIKDVRLPMVGDHNVSNSLAAITVALELGIPDEKIVSAFDGFTGVKRRFSKTGEVDGVTIIDDYGHHPVEIKAVLKAARQATKNNVIAVVQPHRYSRLHDLFEDFCTCFNDADNVIVANVFEAGETPIEGASRDALVEGLRNRGHRHVSALEGPEKLAEMIAEQAEAGDLVVCLGAGSISTWANALPAQLKALKN